MILKQVLEWQSCDAFDFKIDKKIDRKITVTRQQILQKLTYDFKID